MALFDDAFKYGVAKQMMNTVRDTVNTTINEGFTAGGRVLRNAYQGSDLNKARGVIKGALAQSSEGLTESAQKDLANNADVIMKGFDEAGIGSVAADLGKKKKTTDELRNIISNADDKQVRDMMETSYNVVTETMSERGHMTTGGKFGLASAAYIGGTKIIREDGDAPLVPFL